MLIGTVVTACGPLTLPPAQTLSFVPTGFACDLPPSEAYSPGYVFRVDANGVEWLTEDFSPQTSPRRYPAAFGSYDATVDREAGIVANLLEPVGSVGGSANVGATSDRTSKVSFSNAALLLLSDAQEEELLTRAEQAIAARSGSSYFVVRDAIQAQGIDIRLSATDEARLGGQLSIAEIVSLDPNLKLTRDQTLTVKGEFANPLNVCVRAVELEPVMSDAAPGAEVRSWRLTDRVVPVADVRRALGADCWAL